MWKFEMLTIDEAHSLFYNNINTTTFEIKWNFLFSFKIIFCASILALNTGFVKILIGPVALALDLSPNNYNNIHTDQHLF